ncbi:hypothetical protein BU23DRAFT_653257 [Bimuria novae-zelandiae CBS 107.79]|uniref:Phosphatidylinositol N-acetylglucosaminyltransferase subunit H conserved domain-containing protein n=1 Tax=Bimuria novae-zelandiae CBS 107.79 TaxID=1447943 RepID=A0A6A5UWY9_9PLEO|nr:hypothetical protein BU23DRAFT_653257 [Bimuria novae-zelandiae CBS 107.79]
MATIISVLQRLSSPPTQALRTLQPTQATVSYTVSTRPELKTIPAKVSFYVGIALRILVGHVESLQVLIDALPWRYLAPASLLVFYLTLRRGYTEESLTVLRGLGLQTSTTSSIYLRTPTTRFIPTTSVQDIFIHEAFKGFEVRFYLAVVVKGEEDVVVVFPRLLPRRGVLEKVWRGSRACLWEDGVKKSGTDVKAPS